MNTLTSLLESTCGSDPIMLICSFRFGSKCEFEKTSIGRFSQIKSLMSVLVSTYVSSKEFSEACALGMIRKMDKINIRVTILQSKKYSFNQQLILCLLNFKLNYLCITSNYNFIYRFGMLSYLLIPRFSNNKAVPNLRSKITSQYRTIYGEYHSRLQNCFISLDQKRFF